MAHTHDSPNISAVQYKEQGSDPATPAASYRKMYAKSDGVYTIDSAGLVVKLAASAGGMADAVILAPTTSARNVIQPTGNVIPLVVKGHSTQAVSLQEWQNSSAAVKASIGAAGDMNLAGNLTINVASGDANINFQGAAGTNRQLVYYTGSTPRWTINCNGGAESGSDAGSDLAITRFSDAGSGNGVLSIARATGVSTLFVIDAVTAAVTDVWRLSHSSTGTPAAGFGIGVLLTAKSSTTDYREMGRLRYDWTTATDATRKARGTLSAYDTAERDCILWEASGTAAMVGLYGVAPVVRAAAYTQTYGTASRTVNAYTTNNQSAAYTTTGAGADIASKADLNTLRVAYENLRAMADNLLQVVTSLIDDSQAIGIAQ